MNQQKRAEIFARLQRANPDPTTELRYKSPFELLVAVVLSAQATDRSVNKATEKLFAIADSPRAMLELGEEKLKDHIKTIGLFNSKAKHVIEACQILVERFDGHVPGERTSLESLPGVGRKTANVILNTAFGEPTIAVDTHIFRLANRSGLAKGKSVLEVENKLVRLVPKQYRKDAHHWLILHGRYVCTARKPRCGACILEDLCEYGNKTES